LIRHCERSEAIQKAKLLKFWIASSPLGAPRNDGGDPIRTKKGLGSARHALGRTGALALCPPCANLKAPAPAAAVHGAAMPKAYWVTVYRSISDPDKLAAYAKLAPGAIAPFGGHYLARGTANAAYEAGQKERIVISEFPSAEQANAAYNSAAYQDALKALGNGAVRDIRIVEGVE
jgi:uncharacterized protein (DUF1330 family)